MTGHRRHRSLGDSPSRGGSFAAPFGQKPYGRGGCRSRAEAEEAARLIDSVPECAAWFGHIAESGELRHVEVVSAWPGGPAL